MSESNPMENGNCVLLGSDKSAGTMPVYISSLKNRLLGYGLSGLLFIALLGGGFIIFDKERKQFINNSGFRFFISISSLVIFVMSIFFYIKAGYNPAIIFFSIMAIIFSAIAMFLFMDTSSIYNWVSPIFNKIKSINMDEIGKGLWIIGSGIGKGLWIIGSGIGMGFMRFFELFDNKHNITTKIFVFSILCILLAVCVAIYIIVNMSNALEITMIVFIAILALLLFLALIVLFINNT
jgi:hypothetical protein